jgi:beta-lactamase class A
MIVFSCFCFSTLYTQASSYSETYKSFQKLEDKVSFLAKSFKGEYSFIIKDAQKPFFEISRGENRMYPAASLIKLPISAVAFRAVKEKKVSLDDKFVIRAKDITGGSGIIKTMELPVSLTFQEIIEIMISNSDNTATNKIIDILGYDYINKGFKKLGLRHTVLRRKMMDFSKRKKGVENYTSASDIVYLLEKIYKEDLIDSESSQLMLSFLSGQKIKDRIPKYLPRDIRIAHKTGLERGVVHDAGIIFTDKGDIVICVLTKKVKSYSSAKKFIARVSLITYNDLYQ